MKAFVIALACCVTFFFTSCDKADKEVKQLNRGKGVWQIESLQYETYDATGSQVVSDSTSSNPGELVFFTSKTLNGLYDYYLGVANLFDANGNLTESNPFEFYYDDTRANIKAGPESIAGVWTIEDNSRRKQQWFMCVTDANGTLVKKVTMTLRKGRRNE